MEINIPRRKKWTFVVLGFNSILLVWNYTLYMNTNKGLYLFLMIINLFACLMCFYAFHQLNTLERLKKEIEELEAEIKRRSNG